MRIYNDLTDGYVMGLKQWFSHSDNLIFKGAIRE